MFFINQILLGGLAAASLPVLIHLLLRERPKPVNIPTVEFIRRAVERSPASRRLVNFLLLLVRVLIVVFIVLAISRTVWENSPIREAGKGRIAAVLILDDAFYAAHTIEGRPQIESIREAARDYLDKMAPGSRVACFTTRDYGRSLSLDLPQVGRDINAVRPRPGIGDLRAAVRAAGDRLDAEAGGLPRVVVVITDFNTSMVRPDIGPIDAPPGVDLRLIHVPERPGNA